MGAKPREFVTFFVMQLFNYAMCVISYRAVSQANYAASVGLDVVYASFNFWILRKIATSKETTVGWLGYTVGSAVGTASGIWISKLILGS